MRDFAGRVAFITGGGSGIGLGQAKVFAAAGSKIVLADIRPDHLNQAVQWFQARNLWVHAIPLDVCDRSAMTRAADEAEQAGGPVTLLLNNAGVSMFGALELATYSDYDWMMGVNFGGIVNAVQTFVPRMIAAQKGGHIVNTASIAAFRGADPAGIYCASKSAVLGLTEALHMALAKYDIGVSVLCPANVNTNIAESFRTRPPQFRSGYKVGQPIIDALARLYSKGMDPQVLAEHLRAAIERNDLYVIPYPEERERLAQHFDRILKSIPPMSSDSAGATARMTAMAEFRKTYESLRQKNPESGTEPDSSTALL